MFAVCLAIEALDIGCTDCEDQEKQFLVASAGNWLEL